MTYMTMLPLLFAHSTKKEWKLISTWERVKEDNLTNENNNEDTKKDTKEVTEDVHEDDRGKRHLKRSQ